jgi:hypothetical protein
VSPILPICLVRAAAIPTEELGEPRPGDCGRLAPAFAINMSAAGLKVLPKES